MRLLMAGTNTLIKNNLNCDFKLVYIYPSVKS
jgi:hypothetical protein